MNIGTKVKVSPAARVSAVRNMLDQTFVGQLGDGTYTVAEIDPNGRVYIAHGQLGHVPFNRNTFEVVI